MPVKNEYIERLNKVNGLAIKKIKSNSNYTVALMSDGTLLSWGANEKFFYLISRIKKKKWINGN